MYHYFRIWLVACILVITGTVLLCSCANSGKESVHISDIEVDSTTGSIYMNDSAFSGTAWSDDEKSVSIEANAGELTKVVYYHDNGKPAMVTEPEGGVCFFSEEGRPMQDRAFFEKYRELAQNAESIMSSIRYK